MYTKNGAILLFVMLNIMLILMLMNKYLFTEEAIDQKYCYTLNEKCVTIGLAVEDEFSAKDYVGFYKSGVLKYPVGYVKKSPAFKVSVHKKVDILRYSEDSSYVKIKFYNHDYDILPRFNEEYLTGFVPTKILKDIPIDSLLNKGYEQCP